MFALAPGAEFTEAPGRDAVVDMLRERALASGMLVGTYARPDGSIKADQETETAAPAAAVLPRVA